VNLLPFNSVESCPKCGAGGYPDGRAIFYRTRYSTQPKVPSRSGRGSVNVETAGGPEVPHLEKTCETCGFVWFEECKDA
jgi:predicted nucleic-acid-binding Zn-ribbon protein